MREYLGACLIFLLCLGFCFHAMRGVDISANLFLPVGTTETKIKPTVVLDAGHGGEDCGAVGVSGVYEKDINLIIANCLFEHFLSEGYHVVMTRTEDHLLYDPNTVKTGHKKSTDLANRVKIANSFDNALFISIHMNSYPSPAVEGLQVWYGREDGGEELATTIQGYVKEHLQEENHRKPKASGGNMYLLDMAECPSVLIECGFLTSVAECAKLCDENYQKELSFVLFCAIIEYITQTT